MRKFAFLISIFIILINFTSCGLNSPQKIIYNKSVEDYGNTGGLNLPLDINNTGIDIMLVSETEELSDSLAIKELSKRTGLSVNIINVPQSVALRQTQLTLSTNNLPDIMKTTLSVIEINNLGEKGTFVPVNKYLNELPNFRRVFIEDDSYNFVMDSFAASDNNLYFFPKYEYQKSLTHSFLYRKDIFDKHGIKMWENKDEFYNTLKVLKELYPASSPYISCDEKDIFSKWSLSFGVDFPGMYYNENEKLWKYSGTDPKFIEMLEFMKKLVDEKLIDNNFLTTSSYLWEWKISGENGFVSYGDIAGTEEVEKSGEVLEVANPPGDLFKVKKNSLVGVGPYVINNENSLLSLKLLDYLLSPSGIELSTLGVVNKTYEFSDGGVKYIGVSDYDHDIKKTLEEKYGLFISELIQSVDRRSPAFKYTKKESEAFNYIEKREGFVKDYPKVKLNDDERKKVEDMISLLDTKALEFASKYVLGGEADLDSWLAEAEKNGVYELAKIYNKN